MDHSNTINVGPEGPTYKYRAMPHLVILYTGQLDAEVNMTQLCRQMANAMLSVKDEEGKQVFPTGGTRVLAYELESGELKAAIAKSKFAKAKDFEKKVDGHIMLTDHIDECSFRNVKILPGPANR
jgi:hypothetical protein